MIELKSPYVLFLGDAHDDLAIKTASGIVDWRREICVGEIALEGCKATTGLKRVTLKEAVESGAKTLIIGTVNAGGILPENWLPTLMEALDHDLDIAAGLHTRLNDNTALKAKAYLNGLTLFDVRHASMPLKTGKGHKRTGKRLLTVGTDCSIGKKYTSLVFEKALQSAGINATFRATGQTGILITGRGIAIDAVPADFISGAVEWLAPDNTPDHWDIIEGQGSLLHPSFAGVSLGLLHGAQPDAIIVCHEPTRTKMRGVETPMPTIGDILHLTLTLGRLTNPAIRPLGIAVNTAKLSEQDAKSYLKTTEQYFNLPATDPIRFGVENFITAVKAF